MAVWTKSSFISAIGVILLSTVGVSTTCAITPDNPGGGSIQFTIDSGQSVKAISPWIYGTNFDAVSNRHAQPHRREPVDRLQLGEQRLERRQRLVPPQRLRHGNVGPTTPRALPSAARSRALRPMGRPCSSRSPWPVMSRPTAMARSTKRRSPPRRAGSKSCQRSRRSIPGRRSRRTRTRLTVTSSPMSSPTGSRTSRHPVNPFSIASTMKWACGARRSRPAGSRASQPRPWENPPYPGDPSQFGRSHASDDPPVQPRLCRVA